MWQLHTLSWGNQLCGASRPATGRARNEWSAKEPMRYRSYLRDGLQTELKNE